MTAIELLKKDHREALGLIEELQNGNSDSQLRGQALERFGQLKAALSLHTMLEEQVFYHSFANLKETEGLIEDSYDEHRKVDSLLVKLCQPTNDWHAQLRQLKAEIQHHINREENELFPRAERLLGEKQLNEMGRQIQNVKQGKAVTA